MGEVTLAMVGDVIASGGPYQFVSEGDLQVALCKVLDAAFGRDVRREFRLDVSMGRIDFLVGTVGVEVKIAGSPAQLARQITRYLRHEDVTDLVVVSAKYTHATVRGLIPADLRDNVRFVPAWVGAL